ncbi:hypothetical protein TNIN_398341, partial [Trichonephila inaurata madagascariensis]
GVRFPHSSALRPCMTRKLPSDASQKKRKTQKETLLVPHRDDT